MTKKLLTIIGIIVSAAAAAAAVAYFLLGKADLFNASDFDIDDDEFDEEF